MTVHRRRRFPTRNTKYCVRPPWPSFERLASILADRTFSSALIQRWPNGCHRDESAGVAEQRSCLKGYGLSNRQIAAKLALGYTLDELANDITRDTPASFEPALDYVVVKIPRFNFEKFRASDSTLAHCHALGWRVDGDRANFKEAYAKALRSMEAGRLALEAPPLPLEKDERALVLREALRVRALERPWYVAQAFREGLSVDEVHQLSAIDPWFFAKLKS